MKIIDPVNLKRFFVTSRILSGKSIHRENSKTIVTFVTILIKIMTNVWERHIILRREYILYIIGEDEDLKNILVVTVKGAIQVLWSS